MATLKPPRATAPRRTRGRPAKASAGKTAGKAAPVGGARSGATASPSLAGDDTEHDGEGGDFDPEGLEYPVGYSPASPEVLGALPEAGSPQSGPRAQLTPEGRVGDMDADPLHAQDPTQLVPLRRHDGPLPVAEAAATVHRDPVARMLAEVRRYPRLSEAEERELGRAVRERGDLEAARRLVVHNLRLVVAIAHQYRRAWANILDLFQEGSVGLMEAVKRWEPALGPRFGSYAAYWIRAYVLKFLMTNSRLIHVGNTRAGRKLFFRLERERQKLLAGGFEPTPKLLAAKLDVDERDLDEVGRHLDSREVPFDPPGPTADAEEGYALSERIPLAQASPEDTAATSEMSGALHEVMEDFLGGLKDERERVVWRDHLASADPLPLGELGARFGVSKQRMGQIAESLKKRFRDRIVARMGPDIRTDWLGGED